MNPATAPRAHGALRVLVVGPAQQSAFVVSADELAAQLDPGDVVVVNDAATLPASLFARTADGAPVELRLVARLDDGACGAPRFAAVLLGDGDWHTRTEERPAPPPLEVGARLTVGPARARLSCVVESVGFSPRLVELKASSFGASPASIWSSLYRAGRPVQYAHVADAIALWNVQNVYASRPWAVEMPSAGRILGASALVALRNSGIVVARVTHAAGLSSTGDPVIDAHLPLPERYEVPEETEGAIDIARRRGGRVLAVGTSVVRALETAARCGVPSE